MWIVDKGIEVDLGESVNLFGRDPLGCRDLRCACGRAKEFMRGKNYPPQSAQLANSERGRRRYIRDQEKGRE